MVAIVLEETAMRYSACSKNRLFILYKYTTQGGINYLVVRMLIATFDQHICKYMSMYTSQDNRIWFIQDLVYVVKL